MHGGLEVCPVTGFLRRDEQGGAGFWEVLFPSPPLHPILSLGKVVGSRKHTGLVDEKPVYSWYTGHFVQE